MTSPGGGDSAEQLQLAAALLVLGAELFAVGLVVLGLEGLVSAGLAVVGQDAYRLYFGQEQL